MSETASSCHEQDNPTSDTTLTWNQAELINPLVCSGMADTIDRVCAVLDFAGYGDIHEAGPTVQFGLWLVLTSASHALKVAAKLSKQHDD